MTDQPASPAVASLLRRLTLDEKIAQLTGMFVTDLFGAPTEPGEAFGIATERLPSIRPHGVGHLSMAWFLGDTTESMRAGLDRIQAGVREVTPFGIGALVHNEGINGFLHDSGTQFPTAWAQAATWDPDLVGRASAITASHMRETGVHLLFAPVMDLARDPRWGRVHETYGEDPELVSQISVGFVRGVQNHRDGVPVLAGGKHFVGYGASEGGLNQAISQVGRRALVDEHAEPFRRAIREAGLEVVMNSYNEIDGVPSAADRWLLTELLRDRLGFTGTVVSDYDSISMLRTIYHTATTEQQAAAQALAAGLDVELPSDTNFRRLRAALEAGEISEEQLDLATARVLRTKEKVGLLPGIRTAAVDAAPATVGSSGEGRAVRRSIAERSIVLLTNDGVLPFAGRRRVVVTGPVADELRIHFGAYTSVANMEMMLGQMALRNGEIEGIDPATFNFTDIFQARMPSMQPRFEARTRELHAQARTVLDAIRGGDAEVVFAPFGSIDSREALPIPEIGVAVAGSDVVIAVVGERTGWVGSNTAGEGQSTAEPRLPGNQAELIAALADTGVPLVTVLVSGRPLVIPEVADASNALLLAPLLGEEAGEVIADVLFGAVEPGGRLPSTFPRTVGQIPMYHGHHYGSGYDHPTGTRHGYGDLVDQSPLFAFGHGLSYSRFGIDETAVEIVDGVIATRCTVTNSGSRAAETVVQVYARDEAASIVRPVRQLLQFERVALAPGESRTLVLTAPIDRLHYTMADGRRGVEAGDIAVSVGFSSDALQYVGTVQAAATH